VFLSIYFCKCAYAHLQKQIDTKSIIHNL
jgi:hypothetical protein